MSVLSDLRVVAVHAGFRRLLTVRLVSQTGDGMFQAGLATLFFFAPERMATAADVAAAFAVLLLPFTVVGPWAGVLLDRWRRRQVLLVGNAVRVVLTGVLAVLMVTVGVGPAVYVVALTHAVGQPVPARRAVRRPAAGGPARAADHRQHDQPQPGRGGRRGRRGAGLRRQRRRAGRARARRGGADGGRAGVRGGLRARPAPGARPAGPDPPGARRAAVAARSAASGAGWSTARGT